MRLVVFADTHSWHAKVRVPDGDALIFAGDMCLGGQDINQVHRFASWMGGKPHPHKIAIAGNHDWPFLREPSRARSSLESSGVTYLQDEGVNIDGLTYYGSPWQPRFYDWAFNLNRGPQIRKKWRLIPSKIDVLITHGPPLGYGDWNGQQHVGCADLRDELVSRVQLKLHVFGHIHEGYGSWGLGHRRLVNAAICDYRYEPVNQPMVVDL